MNNELKAWRAAGRHLPDALKDFHDQKAVFKAMHAMLTNLAEPDPDAIIKLPSTVEGQCYVIDCFLWFMARHGYTLQRSRAQQDFDSLEDTIALVQAHERVLLAQMLGGARNNESSSAHLSVDGSAHPGVGGSAPSG